MQANRTVLRRLVALAVIIVLLSICVKLYTGTGNGLSVPRYAVATDSPVIDNPELIQNWLPPASYDYMVTHVRDYLAANGLTAHYMYQKGAIDTNNGTYNFTLVLEPQNQSLSVGVRIVNFSSTLSTAITINGVLQGPNGPSQTSNSSGATPQFSGLDALSTIGLTSAQMTILQKSFRTYAPSATTITIDTSTVNVIPPDQNSASITSIFTFTVAIDGTKYNGRLICPGINSAELTLSSVSSHKQVFDSGTLSD